MSSAADAPTAPDAGNASAPAEEPRVPFWAWLVIASLAAAVLAVSIALLFKAHDHAEKAQSTAASNLELMDSLVAEVTETNKQVADLNKQLESISASAKSAASSAQSKAPSKKGKGSSKPPPQGGK